MSRSGISSLFYALPVLRCSSNVPASQEEYSRIDLTVVCADGSQTVIPGARPAR